MVPSSQEIAFPTVEQVVEVNRRMIGTSGGSFFPPANFHNRASLEYILSATSSALYGTDLFPSLKDKAAAISFQIISAHVFLDGNKRTGVHVAWEFLRANGVPLYLDETVEDLAIAIASRAADRSTLLAWLHAHQQTPGPIRPFPDA